MPANLDILASYSGQQALTQLDNQLAKINSNVFQQNQLAKIASAQNKIDIAMLDRRVALLQGHNALTDDEINDKARLISLEQELTFTTENRLNMAANAYTLMRAYKAEGITITEQEAIIANQVNAEIIAGEQAKAAAFNITRKALMGASISMFVLNISVSQLVTSLKPLVEGNEAAEEGLKKLQGALSLSLAPMQAFMAVQMIMTSTTMTLTQALTLFGGAMMFSIGLMGAMTSDSVAMRIAFSALAGVGAVMAATQFLASIATMTLSGSLATLQAVMANPLGLIALAAGVGATAFAVGSIMSMQKAQTLTDHRKRVRKGGLALLDDDEVVTRESKAGTRGGGDTIIYLPENYDGTISGSRFLAKEVQRLVDTGQGTIKVKRMAVSNG